MNQYTVCWGSSDAESNGIYLDDKLVVGNWALRHWLKTTAYNLATAPQSTLARLHREAEYTERSKANGIR